MSKLAELQQQLDTARAEARRLNDEHGARAASEDRDLTADERAAIQKAVDEMRRLGELVEDEQRSIEIERAEAAAALEAEKTNRRTASDPDPNAGGDPPDREEIEERAFELWCRAGAVAQGGEAEDRRKLTEEAEEIRALQADLDIYGGYTLAPKRMIGRLIKAVDDAFAVRQFATDVGPFGASESLGALSLDNDPADAAWTAEIGTVSEDSTMSFGGREMVEHDLTKLIKVSAKLLRKSPRVRSIVEDRLRYKVGVPRENAYMTGSGAGQPLGMFTASALGISTSRDVSTDNGTTAPTFDNLKRVVSTLKQQYHGNARWIMHRDVHLQYELIKDGNGNYIVGGGDVTRGIPMTLRGFPVVLSEYAPNTLTTGQYVAIFGDLMWYYYADASQVALQRLDELYAATRQVGFQIEWGGDGMPVLEEAFVRVKLA